MLRLIILSLLMGFVSACSVNPVTGRNELSIVSEAQERAIGVEQYGPSQQSQGGTFEVDEDLTRYVNQVGQRLAAVSDRPLDYEFVVLNNSVPNAWALPGGKIAVNRGLLYELNTEAELAAVLGHEVVHAAAGHGAQAMTRGTLLQGAMVVGAIATRDNEFSDYILGASQLGSQLITQRYGRDAERESDYYGIQYMVRAGYDPREAVTLQKTFVRLSAGNAPGWIDGLFASHPASQERVRNNQAEVDALMPSLAGRDLYVGREAYQEATAFLRESKPAYELFDEAVKAIADNDMEIAIGNLDEAIRLVPAEARFYGLKADILLSQRRYREAVSSYDAALARDSSYYDYYLGRGVARARLNQSTLARDDLQRSSQLLPTAVAANELGKLSLASGDRTTAKQYFASASQAQGLVAQQALGAFMQLDVSDNPARYVSARVFADSKGRILAQVSNNSPIALTNVRVDFAALINGEVRKRSRILNTLAANTSVNLDGNLGFPENSSWTQAMMSAEVVAVGP